MFNVTKTIESKVKKALASFYKTKNDLEKINEEIFEICTNKEKQILEMQKEMDSLNKHKESNSKVISKIEDFLQN